MPKANNASEMVALLYVHRERGARRTCSEMASISSKARLEEQPDIPSRVTVVFGDLHEIGVSTLTIIETLGVHKLPELDAGESGLCDSCRHSVYSACLRILISIC